PTRRGGVRPVPGERPRLPDTPHGVLHRDDVPRHDGERRRARDGSRRSRIRDGRREGALMEVSLGTLMASWIIPIRWLHVLCASAWLGEVVTINFVLVPALSGRAGAARREFLASVFPKVF